MDISFASCSFGEIFGRQFSWWKVTFFLSSFLLVLLVDCYVVHCLSFASFA